MNNRDATAEANFAAHYSDDVTHRIETGIQLGNKNRTSNDAFKRGSSRDGSKVPIPV